MEEVRDGLKKGGSLLNYARAIIGAVVAPSLVFIRDRVLLKRPEGTREGVVIMVTTPSRQRSHNRQTIPRANIVYASSHH